MPSNLELLVTLWPSMPHFKRFLGDYRCLGGIRLNSAMMSMPELDVELDRIAETKKEFAAANKMRVPLFYDIKSRQMRIHEVHPNDHHLDITLNHPIKVETPTEVLFKAGADWAVLDHLEEDGRRLIFKGGPQYNVNAGESLHIRHPSLKVMGDIFTDIEKQKIEKCKKFGFKRWFLSYVESKRDVDEFRSLVGKDAEVWLKIESPAGLRYVKNEFKKEDNLVLVAARGDMYVEMDRPHEILNACKDILAADPTACVASRILLSTIQDAVPNCADWSELAWLYDIGYRRMMLCDEMCLKEELLARAVNAFDAFREDYCQTISRPSVWLTDHCGGLVSDTGLPSGYHTRHSEK